MLGTMGISWGCILRMGTGAGINEGNRSMGAINGCLSAVGIICKCGGKKNSVDGNISNIKQQYDT